MQPNDRSRRDRVPYGVIVSYSKERSGGKEAIKGTGSKGEIIILLICIAVLSICCYGAITNM